MAQAPQLFGHTKSIRIPAGKEHEYTEDSQGNIVHVAYGTDERMPGTVIPTGKAFNVGGGSHGFSIDDMDVTQNIIVSDVDGQREVTKMTRRELLAELQEGVPAVPELAVATPEAVEKRGEQVEGAYACIGSAVQAKMLQLLRTAVSEPATKRLYNPFEEGLMTVKKPKRRTKKLRRVAESAVPSQAAPSQASPPEQPQVVPAEPAVVRLVGPFGRVAATFSGIFRDGMCLVLYSDARQLSSLYTLPESDEPLLLTVEHDGHVVSCIWAGIQFTMPNAPVTFIVLLVEQEVD